MVSPRNYPQRFLLAVGVALAVVCGHSQTGRPWYRRPAQLTICLLLLGVSLVGWRVGANQHGLPLMQRLKNWSSAGQPYLSVLPARSAVGTAAALLAPGGLDASFDPGTGANNTVSAIALQPDGKAIIGGTFTSYNGVMINRIARVNSDGSLDMTFNPGTGANAEVARIVIQPDGKAIIGGSFNSYNGVGRNFIARINSDGSLDTTFDPGTGTNNLVTVITLQSDGKVLIGGRFANYNGTARAKIARINSDGALDTTFDPGTGANGAEMLAIVLQPDGKMLIGGDFNTFNGVGRGRIARLNSDGSLDMTFDSSTGAAGTVRAIALQSDGKARIAGFFTAYNGTPRSRIARVNSDGSLDTTFDPGTGFNSTVFRIVLQPDNKALLVGLFTTFNGTSRNRIARVNSDGSLDTTFDPGTGANNSLFAIALQADGNMLIGGDLTTYNDIGRNRIARINGNTVMQAYDGFAYPNGDFNGQNGGSGFAGAWTNTGNTIVSTSLTPAAPSDNVKTCCGSVSVAGNHQGAFRSLASTYGNATETIYISFVGVSNSGEYAGVSLFNDNDEMVFMGRASSGVTNWTLDRSATGDFGISNVSTTVTSLLVVRIDFNAGTTTGNERMRLYVNPALGMEPGVADVDLTNAANFIFNRIRIQAGPGTTGTSFDEFRLGSSFADVTPPAAPEIAVSETGVGDIADGASFSFGTTMFGVPVTKTFTVTNLCNADLTLSNLTVPSGFSIAAGFGNTTVTPGNSTTFQIAMTVGAAGMPSGSLSFGNNDPDENPFNFTISGTVTGTPPMINCPTNITTNADAGQCTAVVTFAPTATGSPAPTLTCMPASGFAFPIGTTTVSCTASNGIAPDAMCSFTVTVADNQAPMLGVCPANITNQSAGANCMAAVTFMPPSATDNCGTATVTCTPASGSNFALGTTTVSCVAKDAANNSSAACTFTVQVVDSTAPTLGACPANIMQPPTAGACGAVVNFTNPTATDNCGTPTVTCTPASGTNFPIGTTTVSCKATDAANNLSAPCTFMVTVTASAPPVLSYASPQMAIPGQSLMIHPLAGPSDDGSITSIAVQSVTNIPNPVSITVNNTTGVVTVPGNMPIGSYTVTIRATDNCGSFTDASFTLNVSCVAITVTPQNMPNGFVGTLYTQALGAMGGTPSYAFTLDSGAFPPGLNIVGTNLTGTPTATGMFNFTIKATDSGNCFGTRAYTVVISGTGLQFYPLAHPVRLVDTRVGASACQTPGMLVDPGNVLTVPVRGACGGLTIPANAAAVTGNVTTVGPAANGFLTIYSSSATQPQASNSNYQAGQTLNNVFTVGLGAADGAFKIFSAQKTDVIVDITGYFAPPGAANPVGLFFHPLPAPVRLLDTRPMQTACTTPGTPLPAGTEVLQQGNAICGIPASAVALVGNATTVGPAAQGFLTLFPASETRPLIASGNYASGQTLNSPFTVGLSPSGNFTIYSLQQTDLVVDVLGYYSADASDAIGIGLLFSPLASTRLLDTRPLQPACFTPGVAIPAMTETPQAARNTCTIPATAKVIVGNATTVSPAAQGFLTFWPSDATRPNAATSNFAAGVNFNRYFTVGLGADGAFKVYALTSTHLVVDVSGSFAP